MANGATFGPVGCGTVVPDELEDEALDDDELLEELDEDELDEELEDEELVLVSSEPLPQAVSRMARAKDVIFIFMGLPRPKVRRTITRVFL